MGLRIRGIRGLSMLALGVGLGATAGCESSNPNASEIEKPIVTSDAPQTSEEAAAQAEPPAIQYKRRPR
ncbi:hypothetical protein [Paludisphaera mucosa]|uniref:Uncharacterized protein n=1 Tax=Paludisphaera mucosa TaxID=3030827 RepID=A0ABT6FA53_9BACT|nr:hypothetical protein [Paludisphaera mucosa]MDG3004477.1 hypothetical protein [Paludisphaera mucosa]